MKKFCLLLTLTLTNLCFADPFGGRVDISSKRAKEILDSCLKNRTCQTYSQSTSGSTYLVTGADGATYKFSNQGSSPSYKKVHYGFSASSESRREIVKSDKEVFVEKFNLNYWNEDKTIQFIFKALKDEMNFDIYASMVRVYLNAKENYLFELARKKYKRVKVREDFVDMTLLFKQFPRLQDIIKNAQEKKAKIKAAIKNIKVDNKSAKIISCVEYFNDCSSIKYAYRNLERVLKDFDDYHKMPTLDLTIDQSKLRAYRADPEAYILHIIDLYNFGFMADNFTERPRAYGLIKKVIDAYISQMRDYRVARNLILKQRFALAQELDIEAQHLGYNAFSHRWSYYGSPSELFAVDVDWVAIMNFFKDLKVGDVFATVELDADVKELL